MGGLAQALSPRDYDADDYGLDRIVQLKRCFARCVCPRCPRPISRSILSEGQFRDLSRVLQQMETDIVSLSWARFD